AARSPHDSRFLHRDAAPVPRVAARSHPGITPGHRLCLAWMRRLPLLVAALALAAAPVHAQPAGDWGVHRDPFDPHVIAAYKAILARNPHDASALAKLLELYRRYRTVDQLAKEYGKILDKRPDDWAALVVSGRLAHASGDDTTALADWQKAVTAKPADAAT